MHIDESNIGEHILPNDVDEATTLMLWRDYCIAQMAYCLKLQYNKGARHWTLDHQRSVNDLKYLQFKKIDSERKMKIEKRNPGISQFYSR